MLCPRCNEDKLISDFYSAPLRKTGFSYYCKKCQSIQSKQNYFNKLDTKQAQMREYHSKNKKELNEKSKIRGKAWREANKEKNCAKAARYRAKKIQAIPLWADAEEIQMYYGVAKYLDWISGGFVKHHVDHIIPLQGNNVCGLHVQTNLQVLVDIHNLQKSNKMEL